MSRLSASLQEAEIRSAFPKDVYPMTIVEAIGKKSKVDPATKKGGNPFIEINLEVSEGDFKGRRAYGRPIMVGGIDKNGNAMNTTELARLVNATEIPWSCETPDGCNAPKDGSADRAVQLIEGSDENGFKKGFFFCPDCKRIPNIGLDPIALKGKRVRGVVDIEAGQTPEDPERNRVTKILKAE